MDTVRARPSGSLHQDGILEAIAFAAERLLTAPDWRDVADDVLARLADAADVSRAYVASNAVDGQGRLTSTWLAEWTQPGVLRVMDDPDVRAAPWEESGSAGGPASSRAARPSRAMWPRSPRASGGPSRCTV